MTYLVVLFSSISGVCTPNFIILGFQRQHVFTSQPAEKTVDHSLLLFHQVFSDQKVRQGFPKASCQGISLMAASMAVTKTETGTGRPMVIGTDTTTAGTGERAEAETAPEMGVIGKST